MMECKQIRQYLDDAFDGTLPETLQHAMHQHLKQCASCHERFNADAALCTALQDWQAPPSSPEFQDRVWRVARERNRRWPVSPQLIGLAMAASLVIGIGMGLMLAPAGKVPQDGLQTVAMAVDQAQNVNLAFESVRELQDVTLTLSLPANVELVGYPGQRTLSWRTHLKAGKNQLTLPLIARAGAGGALAASLTHGTQHKEFSLYLTVQRQRDAANSTGSLATYIQRNSEVIS